MDDFLALLDKEHIDTDERGLDSYTQNDIPTFDLSIFDDFHTEVSNIESLVILGFSEIKTDKENQEAVEISSQIKQLIKAIENERKSAKEPYHKVVKLIDGNVKELKDKLESIQQTLKSKIKEYLEKKQLEILTKTQEQIETVEQAGKNDEQLVVIPEISQAVTTTETGATAKLDTVLEWEITDFRALPEECFIERKSHIVKAIAPYINSKIKDGITEISGVTFIETTILMTK